eukprot:EG_transcript_18240
MAARLAWGLYALALLSCAHANDGAPHIETNSRAGGELVEHHSLIGPFISEWWQGGLPHWDFGAAAVVTDKFIRVCPDKQSRVGWLWNDQPNHLAQWEAILTFRIHSRRNPGADGLALWYCERPVKFDPTNKDHEKRLILWGNAPDFKGLGIIFDTYDNDGQRDNPVVTVIQGTGDPNQKWDFDSDLTSQAKLRCVYEFRNTPRGDDVKVRVVYGDKILQVYMSTASDPKETFCGQAKDFYLPTGYYFGITATTGHLADNHDVSGFVVRSNADAIQKEDQVIYGGQPAAPGLFGHAAAAAGQAAVPGGHAAAAPGAPAAQPHAGAAH